MTLVTDHLERLGVSFEVLPHTRSATALDEALSLRLDPDTVLKAVVLEIASGPALAVIAASSRLDLDLVREALDDKSAALLPEHEVQHRFPEFEAGAMPALPSLVRVPVVIDPEVLIPAKVTIAAGVQRESVRLRPGDLFHGGDVTVAPISRRILDALAEPVG